MPAQVNKFVHALREGKIDPERLAKMTSEQRNQFFGEIVGKENATGVNALFESKLLLKNQQRGMITWAKRVGGMKPEIKRDLITRIQRLDHVLDPAEERQFLKDLAATRLGMTVTEAEARKIAMLSRNIEKTRARMEAGGDGKAYGYAVQDMTDYVNELKFRADKINLSNIKTQPLHESGQIILKTAGNLKSLRAAIDNSALFRQGFKLLMTHPRVWGRNAAKTFIYAAKELGNRDVLREINADIISRPNYEKAVRGKLAIFTTEPEEAYPESLAAKFPALGRLYKASEAAFTGFLHKSRMDLFDQMLNQAEKQGVNINNPDELRAIANIVNSLTGRGNIGPLEKNAKLINNVFFSPRLLKSNLDVVLQPLGKGGAKTAFARWEARKNLVKIVGGTFGLLAAIDAIYPGGIEWDPRSSDFGKLRIGDTRIDLTGGLGSLIVLAERNKSGESKSTSSGKITSLSNGGFGQPTRLDTIEDFFLNKLSPAASIVKDKVKGKDFNNNKFSYGREITDAMTPLSVNTYLELKNNPRAANTLLGIVADGLGLNTNTYSYKGGTTGSLYDEFNGNKGVISSWSTSTSKELIQLKQKIGAPAFNRSGKQYDNQLNNWLDNQLKKPSYIKLSSDDKTKLIEKKERELKKAIFDKYSFKYKRG